MPSTARSSVQADLRPVLSLHSTFSANQPRPVQLLSLGTYYSIAKHNPIMKLSCTFLAASTLLVSCAAEAVPPDAAAGADTTCGPLRGPTAPPGIPTLAGVVPRLRTRPVQPTVFEV